PLTLQDAGPSCAPSGHSDASRTASPIAPGRRSTEDADDGEVDPMRNRITTGPQGCCGGHRFFTVGSVGALAAGSVTVNTAPPSGAFSAQTWPPCWCTIARTIESPSPLPERVAAPERAASAL